MASTQTVSYQITLHSTPPTTLTSKFPAITLHATPPTTILSRRVPDCPGESTGSPHIGR
jgi:hypothetical protein